MVARSWAQLLSAAGHRVVTVAGAGSADRVVPGLAWPGGRPDDEPDSGRDDADGAVPPERSAIEAAVVDADLVVVENLCSLPLHPQATEVTASVLRGRPALLHHYDLPWQRDRFSHLAGWPPDDPAWAHVTINDHSRLELAERGIAATTIRCGIDVHVSAGDRAGGRAGAGIAEDETVVLHPVRAIERKRIPVAIRLAEDLGATYWLTGPAEEGYGPTLASVLAAARCKVVHRPVASIADAYAACDAVALPSAWEGFGNPIAEAALHRRPIAVGNYPAAGELAALGLRWFRPEEPEALAAHLAHGDESLHDSNEALLRRHLSLERVAEDLDSLLGRRWSL